MEWLTLRSSSPEITKRALDHLVTRADEAVAKWPCPRRATGSAMTPEGSFSTTAKGDLRMWLFTKHGFFSAVCARQGSGKHGQPVDPGRIMVRARVRGHLDALRSRFPELLEGCEILDSGGTDYAYRLFVAKPAWMEVAAELAEETDYDNFKSEVARHQGKAGAAYEHALHDSGPVPHRLRK